MKHLAVTVIFLFYVSSLKAQTDPGGVSANLIWWVKSNVNVLEQDATTAEDGDPVETWVDNSPSGINAVVGIAAESAGPATRPLYRTNIINGNPALEFDGTKLLDGNAVSGIGATQSFEMFLVFKQDSYQTNGGTLDGNGTFIIDRPTATLNLTSFKVVNTNKYFYQRRRDDNSNLGGPESVTPVNTNYFVLANYYRNTATTREGIYLDGALDIDQAGVAGNITGPRIRIGRHATNASGGLDGYFAEMIIYNANLSAADRQKVETYLAIKYGITLSSTTDYVRRDGTVIYPSTGSHSGFVSDIAGIGRDNGGPGSGLLQSASQSQNANSVVTISNASSLGNNDFLVWGSNGGSLTVPSTSDLPPGIVRKLSRIWRVREVGDVGTFTVTVNLSAVPGSKNSAHLMLLVDANGTFAGGATQYPVSSSSGSDFTFNNVDITNNDYFTIGTTNIATPLPIELTEFNVTYENPVVVASWKTASELNNDFFMLERAGDDLDFEEIGTKTGAGTSKTPHTYSMIDQYPYEGRSYYRLKQTDFDGTFTFSETKHVFIPETEKKLSVFPNPSDGKKFTLAWGYAKFTLDHIEIINQLGKSIEHFNILERNQREYSIELKKSLSPGLYVVKVHYNGKDELVKLIVR